MNNVKKSAAALAALVGIGAAALGGTAVSAQAPPMPGMTPGMNHAERHPELRRALMSLERTEYQLRHSARDFDGHREKAADLCHQAQLEVQLALQADRG